MTHVSMWEFLLSVSWETYIFLNSKKNQLRNRETQRKCHNTPVRIKLNKCRDITSLKESTDVKLKARVENTDTA